MNRRAFVTGLGAVLAAPFAGEAQQARTPPRLGVLSNAPDTAPDAAPNTAYGHFKETLRGLGYSGGHNIFIAWRFSEGWNERVPDLAAELLTLNVDPIVAISAPAALAAKRATSTIPIVFSNVTDRVALGLVDSLARPGGNLTGVSFEAAAEARGKQLELMKEMMPTLARVAALWNSELVINLRTAQGPRPHHPALTAAAGGSGGRVMDRRAVVAGSIALLAAPLGADAQHPTGKIPVIGTLDYSAPEPARLNWWKVFRQGMQELGYVEVEAFASRHAGRRAGSNGSQVWRPNWSRCASTFW